MFEENAEEQKQKLNAATIIASLVVALAMTALNTMSVFNNAEKFFDRRYSEDKTQYKAEVARVDSINKSFDTANTVAVSNWELRALASREAKSKITSAESFVRLARFDTTRNKKLLIAEAQANLDRVRAEVFANYESSNPRPKPRAFVSEAAPVEKAATPFETIFAISLFIGIVFVALEYLLGKDFLASTLHTFLASCYGIFVSFIHVQALKDFFELPLFVSLIFSVAMLSTAFSVYVQTTSRARGGIAHLLLERAKVFWFKQIKTIESKRDLVHLEAAEDYNEEQRQVVQRDVQNEATFLKNLAGIQRKFSGENDFAEVVGKLIKRRVDETRKQAVKYQALPLPITVKKIGAIEENAEQEDDILPPSMLPRNGVSIGFLPPKNERAEPPEKRLTTIKTRDPDQISHTQQDFFSGLDDEQKRRAEGESYVPLDSETNASPPQPEINNPDELSSLVVTSGGVKRTCALPSCEIDISHMRSNKRYCCDAHKSKHNREKNSE